MSRTVELYEGQFIARADDIVRIVTQLHTVARALNDLLPDEETEADLPPHMRSSYITRARAFGEAASLKTRGRKAKR